MTRRHRIRQDPTRLFTALGLAAIVAVAVVGYISYTALRGLPFENRYRIAVDVPNADRVIATSDVRISGVRVGQVESIAAQPGEHGGRPYAHLVLSLDPSAGHLPADTAVKIRPASVLGATYVDLRPGHDARTIAAGGTLPLANAQSTVELTDLFRIFDRSTAKNLRSTMRGIGDGFAGRGTSLNLTIGALNRSLPPLRDVMAAVGAPGARLAGFIRAYAAAADAFAPVSGQFAGIASAGAATFGALASVRRSLGAMLDALPGAEGATTVAFTRTRPAFDGIARLADELRPAGRVLSPSLRAANGALGAGVQPLRSVPRFSGALRGAMSALTALGRQPTSDRSLLRLEDLMKQFDRVLEVLTPAQVHCNVIGLATQNFSSYTGSLGSGNGPSMWNFVLDTSGAQTDGIQAKEPAPDLRLNYVPHENASECESNNEPDVGSRQAFGNPPGLQPNSTRETTPPPGALARARAAGLLAPDRRGR